MTPDPCDPSLAPLRCWGHEDCREHPELALACGELRMETLVFYADDGLMGALISTDDMCPASNGSKWGIGEVGLCDGDGGMGNSRLGCGMAYGNVFGDGLGGGWRTRIEDALGADGEQAEGDQWFT